MYFKGTVFSKTTSRSLSFRLWLNDGLHLRGIKSEYIFSHDSQLAILSDLIESDLMSDAWLFIVSKTNNALHRRESQESEGKGESVSTPLSANAGNQIFILVCQGECISYLFSKKTY